MSSGKDPTLDDLSKAILQIHEAGLDADGWPRALNGIITMIGGLSGTFWMADVNEWSRARSNWDTVKRIASVRPVPASTDEYVRYYRRLDPLRPALEKAVAGEPISGGMLMRLSEFRQTEFYTDFARPNDLIDCAMLRCDDSRRSGVIGIGRSRKLGPFEASHLRILKLLHPHIRQATRAARYFGSYRVHYGTVMHALARLKHGVVVTDGLGTVLFANPAAEQLCRRDDSVRIARQQITLSRSRDNDLLRRTIAGVGSTGGGTIVVDAEVGGMPIVLNVFPATEMLRDDRWGGVTIPTAIIFISDGGHSEVDGSIEVLRSHFGLTAAEAAVATTVVRLPNVSAAAAALGIAPSTLRWHLRTVFAKTNSSRQSKLAQLIERLNNLVTHAPAEVSESIRASPDPFSLGVP
jgi:DNA-binding CsgD family transcriptional regulator